MFLIFTLFFQGKLDINIFSICDFAFLGLQFVLLTILFLDRKRKSDKKKIKKLAEDFEKTINIPNLSSQDLKDIFKSYANAMADV